MGGTTSWLPRSGSGSPTYHPRWLWPQPRGPDGKKRGWGVLERPAEKSAKNSGIYFGVLNGQNACLFRQKCGLDPCEIQIRKGIVFLWNDFLVPKPWVFRSKPRTQTQVALMAARVSMLDTDAAEGPAPWPSCFGCKNMFCFLKMCSWYQGSKIVHFPVLKGFSTKRYNFKPPTCDR